MVRRPLMHDLCWTNHSANAKVPGQSKLAFSWWKENSLIINSCMEYNAPQTNSKQVTTKPQHQTVLEYKRFESPMEATQITN